METPSSIRRPTQTKGERTYARLLACAIEEFRRVGVEAASVGTISENAGVSRPTFYFHFPTKRHVLVALQRALEEPISARVATAPTLREALRVAVEDVLASRAKVRSRSLFAEILRLHTRSGGGIEDDVLSPLHAALTEKFAQAIADGSAMSKMEPGQGASLYLRTLFGFLLSEADDELCRRDLALLAELIVERGTRPC